MALLSYIAINVTYTYFMLQITATTPILIFFTAMIQWATSHIHTIPQYTVKTQWATG